jgi:hypothetical protein
MNATVSGASAAAALRSAAFEDSLRRLPLNVTIVIIRGEERATVV